jgi:hypothetical protein
MRPRRTRLLAALLAGALVSGAGLTGCGDDSGDGDPAAFCQRLDRLTENDPFQAFGDTATKTEMQEAFTALKARADELVEVAPAAAQAAATDYRDAVLGLDELLAGAGYGTDVDVRAYREQQTAYVEAAQRLERYLTAEC